jgi:hypothetical protein
MGKVGIIAVIPKDYSPETSPFEAGLRSRGYSRIPGTSKMITPYRELSGRYRTGLDSRAAYIERIKDPHEKEIEKERVTTEYEKLTDLLQIDLSSTSSYYNTALSSGDQDIRHAAMVKLKDGDNQFNLDDPKQAVTFAWLRVHPTVASSYASYLRGDYPADTQFYVKEEEIETQIKYRKKVAINTAITKFTSMSIERQKKVARMLGLPVTDNTSTELVYNQIDSYLKENEVKFGDYKGSDPIEMFSRFADMQDDILYAKDLVEQAIKFSIYRYKRGGKIEEGTTEIAKNKEDLVEHLLADNKELITLEEKLKQKKVLL